MAYETGYAVDKCAEAPRPVTEMDERINYLENTLGRIRNRLTDISLRVAGSAPPTASTATLKQVSRTYDDRLQDVGALVNEVEELVGRIDGKI